MLNLYDFLIEEDESEYVWVVNLDGVRLGSFTNEEDAKRFVDWLVALEVTKEALKKHSNELHKGFENERKRKSHSPSM
jgi:hypothetical protein